MSVRYVDWKFMRRRLNPMDTVESSNQYVSGMTVKNSHRVSLYIIDKKAGRGDSDNNKNKRRK